MGKLKISKTVSVKEIILTFRGALNSILPWIEKVNIKWKEGESYDDWDNIATSLYQNIVCATLYGEVQNQYLLVKYDFHYENYSGHSFIKVKNKLFMDKYFAFVSFTNNNSSFIDIKVAELDHQTYKTIRYLNLELDDLEFSFVNLKNGFKEEITEIEIE